MKKVFFFEEFIVIIFYQKTFTSKFRVLQNLQQNHIVLIGI